MKITIVTDSTSYLSREFIEKEGIKVVPLQYVFEGKEYKERLKGTFDDFYRKLEASNEFPTTSQPSAGDFKKVFSKELEKGNSVIAILLSSKLSGTVASAATADKLLDDKRVTIVDTLNAASTIRFMVEEAIDLIKQEKTTEQIKAALEEMKKGLRVTFFAGSLEYLKRGGRLSSSKQIVGDLLSIKPVIGLINGELKEVSKQRGVRKAENFLFSTIPSNVKKIGICHITNIDGAKAMKKRLEESFPSAEIAIDELGPVIGSHLGPKTLGLCYYSPTN